jgi:chromosome segregation ATPase
MFILIGFLGGGALGVARFPKQIANVPMNLITVSSGASDRASSTGSASTLKMGKPKGKSKSGAKLTQKTLRAMAEQQAPPEAAEWTATDFLKLQDFLRMNYKALVDSAASPRSARSQLTDKKDSLPLPRTTLLEQNIHAAEHQFDSLIATIKAAAEEVGSLQDNVSSVERARERYKQAAASYADADSKVQEQLDAVNYVLSQKNEVSRKAKDNVRYQRNKVML